MRLAVTTVLLAVAAGAVAQDRDPGFASTLPAAIGDVSGWEVVTGDFETARMRGSYRFYVNPARQAMYQLMRYRVELLGQKEDAARWSSGERVAFVQHPGTHDRMLVWVHEPTGIGSEWRPLVADTDEYKVELGVLLRVLAVHPAARTGASP
jgi:hypothetical protein